MKPALKAVLAAILLGGIVAVGWWVWKAERDGTFQILFTGKQQAVPDTARYEVLVAELQRWREELARGYAKARTDEQRQAVEKDARVILEIILPEMMRCWVGTPYDFNGTAEKPGKERIACGYYVSTVIRDAGFRVDRYKLAQQPSENILRTFLPGDSCMLRVGEDYPKYADWVERLEPGVYLLGLDTHVGFIVVRSDGMHFFHSSGADEVGVVEENRDNAWALRKSKWRMLGHLTADSGVMRNWLTGEKIKVRTR
ncbi:hypothetical protein HZ994_00110 [Akkermansiaceae bacterium]|nr:hypothetical protein HZ994_00110 [Akkermansiaceae bacterium]